MGYYDPTKDVPAEPTENMGVRYTFRLLATNGRIVKITGGSRLLDEFIKVCSDENGKPNDSAKWVKITAHGSFKNIMDRSYTIVEVPKPA